MRRVTAHSQIQQPMCDDNVYPFGLPFVSSPPLVTCSVPLRPGLLPRFPASPVSLPPKTRPHTHSRLLLSLVLHTCPCFGVCTQMQSTYLAPPHLACRVPCPHSSQLSQQGTQLALTHNNLRTRGGGHSTAHHTTALRGDKGRRGRDGAQGTQLALTHTTWGGGRDTPQHATAHHSVERQEWRKDDATQERPGAAHPQTHTHTHHTCKHPD